MLKNLNIDNKDVRIVRNLYWSQKAGVRIGGTHTEGIDIRRKVRQGCTLSPLLFNLYTDTIFKEALKDLRLGIKINGELLNNFRYVDVYSGR